MILTAKGVKDPGVINPDTLSQRADAVTFTLLNTFSYAVESLMEFVVSGGGDELAKTNALSNFVELERLSGEIDSEMVKISLMLNVIRERLMRL